MTQVTTTDQNVQQGLAPLTSSELKHQINLIQEHMRDNLIDGEHYGKIPGTDKPTLFKAGAEKLSFIFRLSPSFKSEKIDLPNGHREYLSTCTLMHNGRMIAEGQGSCSTMESKYRYRGGVKVSTGRMVPKEYWNLKKDGKAKEAQELIGGRGFGAMKGDSGQWEICEIGDKMENPDIADAYNTVLKMANKRALVAATLLGTAASDIFTQDLEDMDLEVKAAPAAKEQPKQEFHQAEDVTPPVPKDDKPWLTEDQKNAMIAAIADGKHDQVKAKLANYKIKKEWRTQIEDALSFVTE